MRNIINNLDKADTRRSFTRTLFGEASTPRGLASTTDETMTEEERIDMQAVFNQVALEAILLAETPNQRT